MISGNYLRRPVTKSRQGAAYSGQLRDVYSQDELDELDELIPIHIQDLGNSMLAIISYAWSLAMPMTIPARASRK